MDRVEITKFKNGKYHLGIQQADGQVSGETYDTYQELMDALDVHFKEGILGVLEIAEADL